MLGTPVVRTRASARAEQAYRRIHGQAVVGSRTSGCRGAAVGRMGTKLPAVLVELLAQGWRRGGRTRGCRVKVVPSSKLVLGKLWGAGVRGWWAWGAISATVVVRSSRQRGCMVQLVGLGG